MAAANVHADDKPVEYGREVLPIFAARCYQCHGPAKEESKFRLDVKDRAYAGGESGQPAIVPGDPEKSQLIRFVRGDCEDKVMPAEGERLSQEQVDLLTRWVKEGAKWEEEEKQRRCELHNTTSNFHAPTSPPGLPRWDDDWLATSAPAFPLRLRRPCAGGATTPVASESRPHRHRAGGGQETWVAASSRTVTRPPARGRWGEVVLRGVSERSSPAANTYAPFTDACRLPEIARNNTAAGLRRSALKPPQALAEPAGLRQPLAGEKKEDREAPKRVAAVVTVYYHNSHADVICSRLLQTYTLDGKGDSPRMKLASLFTDQVHENDISRKFADQYGFSIQDTVAGALTLGTGELAVDGVLLVAEHGKYPVSETGSTVYPKRRLFDEIVAVFKHSGRVVPLFIDKHLADNWQDAKHIYDTCREMKIPLMAGSSLPTLWRYPAVNVAAGAKLKQIVAVSYHTLDGYGFHALEMVQCLAEQRAGGETGIKQVQTLTGDAAWAAADKGVFDPKLLEAALGRLKRPPSKDRPLKEQVAETPVLWVIDYADGLRANVFTLNYVVGEWAAAWQDDAGATQSTLFYTQEARPLMHFSYLVQGIDQMMQSGEPAWPADRTLLTSGMLDALLISQKKGGELLPTPQLDIDYGSKWRWAEPPPPPEDRPLDGQ